MEDKRMMKWQVDFGNYFDIFNTFIIDGNIDDIQPQITPEDECRFVRLGEWFTNSLYTYREEDRKCVIIYDPTESEDKRFTIAVPFEEVLKEPEEGDDRSEDAEPEYDRIYADRLAQHFWDILHEERLEDKMIGHNAGGVSLDMARIHYAVTENGRMTGNELLDSFRGFWDSIFESTEPVTTGYVFIIKMTSRLLTRAGSNGMSPDELLLFRQMLNISQSMSEGDGHRLIVLANRQTDLPMWFTDEASNPYVRKLTIERPTEDNKLAFFDRLIEEVAFGEEFNAKYEEMIRLRPNEEPDTNGKSEGERRIKRKFLAYTNDFTMKMLEYYQSYLMHGHPIASPDKLGYSISGFRAGELENPWEKPEKVREMLAVTEKVAQKIKGQEHALRTVQNILTRAAVGLGRADNPGAPRVVLFLAGPTGTGKTEICKQLAETIFGSSERIIRFDMSEYGAEHADQKLFGAPPGYVGYEEGGKLTNAMKKEPFSLVLFDEIEKAHGSIMDKFLQILSDGRLTDGKGETVSFTDAIIAFTSNAGVTSPTPQNQQAFEDMVKKMGGELPPEREINMRTVCEMEEAKCSVDEIYAAVSNYFRYNVKHYFCCTLGRPELYGRIEDALVYYNYIGELAVPEIVEARMDSLVAEAKDRFRLTDVTYDSKVLEEIVRYCCTEGVRSMGARGINKAVSVVFETALSNFFSPYILRQGGQDDLIDATVHCSLRADHAVPVTADDLILEVL